MSSEKGKGACVVPDPDRWLSLSNLFNDISSTLIWKFYNIENVTLLIQSTSQCKNNLSPKAVKYHHYIFLQFPLSLSHNLEQFEMINVLHMLYVLYLSGLRLLLFFCSSSISLVIAYLLILYTSNMSSSYSDVESPVNYMYQFMYLL